MDTLCAKGTLKDIKMTFEQLIPNETIFLIGFQKFLYMFETEGEDSGVEGAFKCLVCEDLTLNHMVAVEKNHALQHGFVVDE
jgi:hypothetical protein